jgi:hypothetical protein
MTVPPEHVASNASWSARRCAPRPARPTFAASDDGAAAGSDRPGGGALPIAHRGLAVQQCAAESVEIGRHVRDTFARGKRVDGVLLRQDFHRGSDERRMADDRLVEDRADAVPVARGTGLLERLFRCHVARGTNRLGLLAHLFVDDPGDLGGDAEVEQDDASFLGDKDVGWLDVPVQLTRAMEGHDPLDELAQGVAQAIEVRGGSPEAELGARGLLCPRPLHMRQEVRAANELHREEDAIGVGHHELVQAHEIAMIHVRQRAKLLLEHVERCGRDMEQRLERDGLSSLAVPSLVNDPHAPLAKAAHDFVARGPLPVGEQRRRLRRSRTKGHHHILIIRAPTRGI